jgi:hypothetical protein
MGAARARRIAPMSMGIAMALGAGAAPDAAAKFAGLSHHDGAIVLRQQLRALMPPVPKTAASPASLLPVTSCADDGGIGTLRTVVDAAGEGDTIDLSALACSTITLTQGAIPLLLNDVTIVGPGAKALAIDGAGSDRVLVHPGYGTLTVTGLTLRNGAASVGGYHITGGGCIASAGNLVLDHSVVRDCRASAEGVYGGGIFAYTLTMYTSTLSGAVALGQHPNTGTAAFGGGVYTAYVYIVDSTISGNRATHDFGDGQHSYDIGGGIFTDFGGSIRSSTIDNNYSYGFGGGVSAFIGAINIANSTVSGNTAKTRSGGGLDLRVFYGGKISNSTITANVAPAGGGINLRGLPDQFELESTLVGGNTATAGAGADFGSERPTTLLGNNNLVVFADANVTLPNGTLHSAPLLLPLAPMAGDSYACTCAGQSRQSMPATTLPRSPAISAAPDFRACRRGSHIGASRASCGCACGPNAAAPVPSATSGWALAIMGVAPGLGQ